MFNIKNIVNKITERGRESNPNSPGRATHEDDAEGFLCPKCMRAFPSPSELQSHYELLHDDDGLDPQGATGSIGFLSLHQEVGERYKQSQDGSTNPEISSSSTNHFEVSMITDVVELQRKLKDVLQEKAALLVEKEHVEQRAAQLAQINVTLKAASDEGESSQIALKERLKVVEAQLAHRESIDDAAVLRQELVQVQRVMDELNRERERERDALRAELQQLKSNFNKETLLELKARLELRESECSQLVAELDKYKQETSHMADKLKEEDSSKGTIKELQSKVQDLMDNANVLKDKAQKESTALKAELSVVSQERDELKLCLHKLQESSTSNIDELKLRLESLSSELQEKKNKLMATDNEMNTINKLKDSLKIELFQKTQRVEELEQLNTVTENKVCDLKKTLAKNKETILRLESEHSELVAQIQAGEGANTAIQQLTQENNSLQEKLKEQVERHSTYTEKTDKKMMGLHRQLTDVESRWQQAELQLDNEKANLRHAVMDMEATTNKLCTLQEQIRTKDTALKDLDRMYHATSSLLERVQKELSDTKTLISQKSTELSDLSVKNESLQSTLYVLQKEVEILQSSNVELKMNVSTSDSQVQLIRNELRAAEEQKDAREQDIIELKDSLQSKEEQTKQLIIDKKKALEGISILQEKLKTVEEQLQVVGVQRASLETSLFEVQKSMAELEGEKKDIEEEKKRETDRLKELIEEKIKALDKQEEVARLLMEEKRELSKELESVEHTLGCEISDTKALYDELNIEFKSSQQQNIELEKNLSGEVRTRCAIEAKLDKMHDTLDATIQENNEKVKVLQTNLDEVFGEKLALEAQLESSQAEQQALLERCYASVSEADNLHRTIADLRRKWDESQAALHELGRENQTLQLDIEKLIGRKWAEDSDVNNCNLCHRDFTMIMRKHHCRNCGQIFCNECSSKTAPVVSNKKPVRVCDSCYNELTPK